MAFSLRSLLILPLLAAAVACSPLEELKHSGVEDGTGFNASLATEYLSFAESEAGEGREEAGEYFAAKGLEARDRGEVPPEKPRALKVPAGDDREDMQGARRRLLSLQVDLLKHVAAQSLARAQVLYDCWVYQEASGEPSLAEPCRSGFLTEIHELEAILASQSDKENVNLPANYTIYFSSGSTALNRDAYYVVDQVKRLIHNHPDYSIDISGHTDSVGSAERNLFLSQKRAETVARALVENGVDAERITTAWLGEDDPQTPALDETARRDNRRVEIDVTEQRLSPALLPTEKKADQGAEPKE